MTSQTPSHLSKDRPKNPSQVSLQISETESRRLLRSTSWRPEQLAVNVVSPRRAMVVSASPDSQHAPLVRKCLVLCQFAECDQKRESRTSTQYAYANGHSA